MGFRLHIDGDGGADSGSRARDGLREHREFLVDVEGCGCEKRRGIIKTRELTGQGLSDTLVEAVEFFEPSSGPGIEQSLEKRTFKLVLDKAEQAAALMTASTCRCSRRRGNGEVAFLARDVGSRNCDVDLAVAWKKMSGQK